MRKLSPQAERDPAVLVAISSLGLKSRKSVFLYFLKYGFRTPTGVSESRTMEHETTRKPSGFAVHVEAAK
jgi:hypothetical protein